jgi:8-oxo-dGTP pyrophosphatase MutT (NUDIX family)
MTTKVSQDSSIQAPRHAATVILVREADPGPFEVFLMRRHRRQSFMGNAFVFPGGRLEDGDSHPELARFSPGFSADQACQALREPHLPPETALGLYFAAIRETFEEAGALLAVRDSEEILDLAHEDCRDRYRQYRLDLHAGRLALQDLARQENLHFRLELLTPYSHWITPEIESKRFDTRFLLARIPGRQKLSHDAVEMTESVWITPQGALARKEMGEMLLMPPTLITLEELAAYTSIEQLFTTAADRDLSPIMPQVFTEGQTLGLKLPYDPEYSIEAYKQPPRPATVSRLYMTDQGWQTGRYDQA